MTDLTQADVRELLDYDPETGVFRWRVKQGRKAAGAIAGSPDHGYVRIGIKGHHYYAHQLAWLWMMGRWATEIDHKNRNPADNRWRNLRAVSHRANGRNQVLRNTNSSGATGVFRHKSGVFHPYIHLDGHKYHLGTFQTFEEARAARHAAQDQHGFSVSHGTLRRRQRDVTRQRLMER